MKQITFLRHAKSEWANANLKDIDRALNQRGYADAYAMSEWFLEKKQIPDLIYSSSATRALSTTMIFVRTLGLPMTQFAINPLLYESHLDYLYEFIQSQNNALHHILIVGHNPVTMEICNDLLKNERIEQVPTCALLSLEFNCKTWTTIESKMGKIKFYQFPKEINN